MKSTACFFLLLFPAYIQIYPQNRVPDLGNGRYKNPVICADYSYPDVIRVKEDI